MLLQEGRGGRLAAVGGALSGWGVPPACEDAWGQAQASRHPESCVQLGRPGGTSVWPPSGPSEAEKLQKGARTPNTGGGHPSPHQAGE